MATLVLTAAGAIVGGPVGAAIGAVVGQYVDSKLFAPKARQGPRLGELAVQTSSYGAAIPKLFGKMRVAGSVVWATDLKEERSRSGGGKGRARTETYSYSASFAVALSAREVRGIGRIWADGKLLRGAAGDFKTQTGFRFYVGNEAQAVDPLIAAVEGAREAPAHRGIAYAVFEDFQLSDYGNRIPSLTFEVEADPASVSIGQIAAELSHGEILPGDAPQVAGYAATGESVRAAIEGLAEAASLALIEEGERFRLGKPQSQPVLLDAWETDTRGGDGAGGRTEFHRRAAGTVPAEISIAYYDVDRDFQTGLQRAARAGLGARAERSGIAVALHAGAAKAMAQDRLSAIWSAREGAKIYLPWRRSCVRPGARLRLPEIPGVWSVARWGLHGMVIGLELTRERAVNLTTEPQATPGRAVSEDDRLHGPTTLFVCELPSGGDVIDDRPRIYAAAAGAEAGWRRAALLSSWDGGASWTPEAPLSVPATLGHALTQLSPSGSALFDVRQSLVVELLNEAMWLESRSDAALAGGANMALIGEELFQFGAAEPLGGGRFRLSRLLRGRGGTEELSAGHAPGDRFLLLEYEKLVRVGVPAGLVGAQLQLVAQGLLDGIEGVLASRMVEGRAMRPPSPVHFAARTLPAGDIRFSWVRRSRAGWQWLNAEAPLGEERELYRLVLSGTGFRRTIEVDSPAYVYTAAQQAEDGGPGAVQAEVSQIGTHGPSGTRRLSIA